MEDELGRLRTMYGELHDEQVLELARDRDALMPDAQIALAEELRRRRLESGRVPAARADDLEREVHASPHGEERAYGFGVGIPGMVPGAAPLVDQALEPGGEGRSGMVRLMQFYDGLALSNACDALDEAGIAPAIEEIEGDATVGLPGSFQLWVDAGKEEEGKAVLRAKLGLFPLAEADELSDAEAAGEVTGGDVGDFETLEEAERVRALLEGAGFRASIDAAAEEDDEVNPWTTVKVEPRERAAAMRFLEEKMRLDEPIL